MDARFQHSKADTDRKQLTPFELFQLSSSSVYQALLAEHGSDEVSMVDIHCDEQVIGNHYRSIANTGQQVEVSATPLTSDTPTSEAQVMDLISSDTSQSEDEPFTSVVSSGNLRINEYPPIARLFVSTSGAAHLVYYPAVASDDSVRPRDISLKQLVKAVDTVRASAEFQKICEGRHIQEHLNICTYPNHGEPHYVAATRISGRLRVINPKGVLGESSDPDFEYLADFLPIDSAPIHLGNQGVFNTDECGHWVGRIHGVVAQDSTPSALGKMQAISLNTPVIPLPPPTETFQLTEGMIGQDTRKRFKLKQALKKNITTFIAAYIGTTIERMQKYNCNSLFADPEEDGGRWDDAFDEFVKKKKTILDRHPQACMRLAYDLISKALDPLNDSMLNTFTLERELRHFDFLARAAAQKKIFSKTFFNPDQARAFKEYDKNVEFIFSNYEANRHVDYIYYKQCPLWDKTSHLDTPAELLNKAQRKRDVIASLNVIITALRKKDEQWLGWDGADTKIVAFRQVIEAIRNSSPYESVEYVLSCVRTDPIKIKDLGWSDTEYCDDENGKRCLMPDEPTIENIITWRRHSVFTCCLFGNLFEDKSFASDSGDAWRKILKDYEYHDCYEKSNESDSDLKI